MRVIPFFSVVIASLLVSGVAAAQGAVFGNGSNAVENEDDEDPDYAQSYAARKQWSAGTSFETNRTILQEDVGGRNKAFNTLSMYASYNIGTFGQVRATGGLIQRFIADETETGIRGDDIGISYAHRVKLPWNMMLAPRIANSIPISFNSRLMGMIALPRASLFLTRSFLDNYLQVNIVGGAAYYIVEYRQAVGQIDANPRASTNIGFNVNYAMPFHSQLQVGAGASTSYLWSYDVDHRNDPVLAEQFKNRMVEPSADQYVTRPPAQQGYGWEAYVSYQLPDIKQVNSQLQLAVAQSDGVLRDGATHLYWLSRRGGQVSASLTISY
jgi:hypothetical protein